MILYTPWLGCKKISEGCQHCFAESLLGENFNVIKKTNEFKSIPLMKKNEKVMVGLLSDFYLPETAAWRQDIYRMMESRPDLSFTVVTKYPENIEETRPSNLKFGVTIENQRAFETRLPWIRKINTKVCLFVQPILDQITLSDFNLIEDVRICGESDPKNPRVTKYSDIKFLYDQCRQNGLSFIVGLVGSRFENENGKIEEYGLNFEKMAIRAIKLHLNTPGLITFDAQMGFHYDELIKKFGVERETSIELKKELNKIMKMVERK
jgi:protein gp37